MFNIDVGFYVFQLPFIKYLYGWLFFALMSTTIVTALIYYANEAIETYNGRVQFAPKVKEHLAVLVALMFFLKAVGYRLGMYDLLTEKGSFIDGASFSSVHAHIPGLWVMVVVAVLAGLLVLVTARGRGTGGAVVALGSVIVVSILALGIYPAAIQSLIVKPNQIEKESPYIKRSIDATLQAFGLSEIAERPFAANTTLTPAEIEANDATVENIRLWDADHLREAYSQIQTIQQYYHFPDVDVDRYWLAEKPGGEKRYRQVWLSARELDQNSLPQDSQTWINRKLQYTHGFGYCMSPVNEFSDEGLPEFFVYDIPPKTTLDVKVENPAVYFGEITHDNVFVNTNQREFDYPSGENNIETTHSGEGGIRVGGLWRRILFAFRFSDINIILNSDIRSNSKMLMRREIKERVTQIFPFLIQDQDPYLVTADGKLYWMLDAYTATDAYPYSKSYSAGGFSFNYLRNSVKIVVDAYSGRVDAYVIEKPLSDPIIRTYKRIFPGAFKPISDMPDTLREHIRYPEDLFRVQTRIFSSYHMTEARTFYMKSDLWEIPTRADLTGASENPEIMEPYYVIMKLPNGQKEEFILMTPFTRANKPNMVAWMCAKCDGTNYGQLVLYRFPNEKTVYGPKQIAARIRQDTVISQQLTLWSQQGSSVSSGNLMVIPIESSLLYVMPLYLESTSTKIPELKRVIVALGNKVAMEPSLNAALSVVVGGDIRATRALGQAVSSIPAKPAAKPAAGAPGKAPAADSQIATLTDRAISQYEKAQAAQRRGDWAEYGTQVEQLKVTLKELQARTRAE